MKVVPTNKRIQEIASLAHCSIDGMGYGEGNIEQFAKLIIKETLQVARTGIKYGDSMEGAVYKYFGVEE